MVKCPNCLEEILDEAIICLHCGKAIHRPGLSNKDKNKVRLLTSGFRWTAILGGILFLGCVAFFLLVNIRIVTNLFTEKPPDGLTREIFNRVAAAGPPIMIMRDFQRMGISEQDKKNGVSERWCVAILGLNINMSVPWFKHSGDYRWDTDKEYPMTISNLYSGSCEWVRR